MIRFIAKIIAKWNYVFSLEFESAKGHLNADLAQRNAAEKRSLSAKLRAEADAIEANIAQVQAEEEKRKETEEYKKLTPKEKYEDEQASKKERQDAESMAKTRAT